MRSPKIEALHRLIDWFNIRLKNEEQLPKLGLDTSSLKENAWLSGFIEADGNFYNEFFVDTRGYAIKVKYYMRISQRQNYLNKNLDSSTINVESSYLPLITQIKEFLEVTNITSINRRHSYYTEYGYEIRTVKVSSRKIVVNYLSKFPLFSSKYQDYLAWLEIHNIYISKQHLSVEGAKIMSNIKKNMNESRTEFNWDTLNYFYNI